jgi:hypothetical protein
MVMSRLLKFALFGLIFSAIGLLLSSSKENAEACGGFFCSNTPIDQNAERIIFTINGDGTITAIVGINYVGEAADFSWVVPVPSPPELDVAEASTLTTLDLATLVGLRRPTFSCGPLDPSIGLGGDKGSPSGIINASGTVGPFEYVVLSSDDPDELVEWLRENDYRVETEMEPVIDVYVQADMYFLAMKLRSDADVGDIQPVVMTYESDQPMIPIRLTAVAAVDNMPIITWIFANTQYVPQNYAHPSFPFERLSGLQQVASHGVYGNYYFSPTFQYAPLRDQVLAEHDGQAFMTEYAGPSSIVMETTSTSGFGIPREPYLEDLAGRFPYLTRLYGRMSPEQMTLDPIFVPDPNAPDYSNVIELDDHVDPIAYGGCSTRSMLREDDQAQLPDGRTRIEEWQFTMVHPDDWVLSQMTLQSEAHYDDGDEVEIYVLSPEMVTLDTIRAFLNGDDTPPMLMMMEANGDWLGFYDRPELILERFGLDIETEIRGHDEAGFIRYQYDSNYDENARRGVLYAIFATEADWEANRDLYNFMSWYGRRMQYYRDPDLPHTLYLPVFYVGYGHRIEIAYDEGWVENMTLDWEITIRPEDYAEEDMDSAPYIRLIPMDQFARGLSEDVSEDDYLYQVWGGALDWMVAHYDFAAQAEWTAFIGDHLLSCEVFEGLEIDINNDREGIARLTHSYIVEVSAPSGEFGDYEDELMTMYADVLGQLEAIDSTTFTCDPN